MLTDLTSDGHGLLRPDFQRRKPPDRGIVLLAAKGRLGPKIWALYGKVERPVVLRDDCYLDNAQNPFYRDQDGHAFLLVPYIAPDTASSFELADAAYRRAVALGVIEKPEIFFTCVYQFQLPEFRCLHIHADKADEVLEEDKCIQLMGFEKLRLRYEPGTLRFSVEQGKKLMPVTVHCERNAAAPSTNLLFALNSLVLHHYYNVSKLQSVWDTDLC